MKTYMTETALGLIAAVLIGSAALAEPVNDPRAEVFRAAGCAAEYLKPVTDADGEVLYWTNTHGKGCDASKRGGFRDDVANGLVAAPVDPVDPGEEEPTDPKA